MSRKSSAFLTSLLLATVAAWLSAQSAAAASRLKHGPIGHHLYNVYSTYGRDRLAHPAALPYGPEYGFLSHVPANAIRTPGYTFVPGVGILGESCDLPTSACSNEYRDVQ
jgi:hypothetical protein